MTLKVPPSDEATLILGITKVVSGATVYSSSKNIYGIDRDWESEIFPLLDERFAKALAKNLDDGGLTSFIRDHLSRIFVSLNPSFTKKGLIPVTEFGEFSEPLKVAENIVTELKMMPSSFALSTRFSKSLSRLYPKMKGFRFSVSDRLEIVSSDIADTEIPHCHPDPEMNKWIWGKESNDPSINADEDSLYFIYRASGAITDKFDSKLFRDFSDDLRSFYGACFAFNLLYGYGDDSAGEVLPRAVAVRAETDDRTLWHMQPLDSDLIRATYEETSLELDKRAKDASKLEEELTPISRMFKCSDAAKLKTASSWLLRANLSDRDMDRVLESTIALEVLLGDKDESDKVGLSRLMANRCAYSLGKSGTERKELSEFFTAFYRSRSDIVHSGTFKVSDADRAIVRKGLSLAHRVLRHEAGISNPVG